MMSKFTFKSQFPEYNEFTGDVIGTRSTTTVEFEAEDLKEVISEFENFLRGSGFKFDGTLEIINETFFDNSNPYDHIEIDQDFELNYPTSEFCSVCGISKKIMENHQCFDNTCPKESW